VFALRADPANALQACRCLGMPGDWAGVSIGDPQTDSSVSALGARAGQVPRTCSRARAPVCSCHARVTVCSAARSRSATGRRTCTATRAVRSGSPARRSPVSTPSAPSTASAEPMRKRAAGADRGLPPFGQRRAGHRRPDHATAACVHRRSSRVNHSSETRSPVAGDAAAVVGELGPTASRLRTGHTDGISSRTSTAAGWSRTGRASEHLQAEVRAVLRCARS
jgi:hypothetical protein